MSNQSPAVQFICVITWLNMLFAIWLRIYDPERIGWGGLGMMIVLAILMLSVNFNAPKREEPKRW